MAKTAVLIHGAFCGGWCFADFIPVLTALGYTCHAPDLRFHVSGPARDVPTGSMNSNRSAALETALAPTL